MKFKEYLALIVDPSGFIPTPKIRWVIRKNDRSTAREEAIAHEVLRQANPRENVTGSFPWAPEEQLVLQQMFVNDDLHIEWRDVPIQDAEHLYTVTDKGLPVPNAVREPGTVKADFAAKIREAMGEDYDG